MSTTRIPYAIGDFNSYLKETDDYLQAVVVPTNGTRLSLTTTHVADWNAKRTAWDTLKELHDNPLTKTSDVNDRVRNFIKDFHTFGNPLLNIVAASPNFTQTDANVFHIAFQNGSGKGSSVQITDTCFADIKAIGGGDMQFRCHDEGSARASLNEHADIVEISYVIAEFPPAGPQMDGTTHKVFSRAGFVLNTGSDHAGKKMWVWVRWGNLHNQNLSGPWGLPQQAIIL